MESVKKAYYVDMTTEEVLPEPLDSPSFRVFATPQEVSVLQRVLHKNQEEDFDTYISAHIPNYVVYEPFDDPRNKDYDASMIRVYSVIYALGDEEAKRHIESMGILSSNKSENPTYVSDENR